MLYYKPLILTDAANVALELLIELRELVVSVKLPIINRDSSIKLERGQTDITTDPKKVRSKHACVT